MLSEVADGVLVRQSDFCLSNGVVVVGTDGLLLVDPGVSGADLAELAADVAVLGLPVTAGFATHPHWDHVLWHEAFGTATRFATARAVARVRDTLVELKGQVDEFAPGAPTEFTGILEPLPEGAGSIPWDGPAVSVIEHDAHAPGHAALLIEAARVVVAGDMLSDVEIPLLDLDGDASAQLVEYERALRLLQVAFERAEVLIPGHGAVAYGTQIDQRLVADRAYLAALRGDGPVDDARIDPSAAYGREWLPRTHHDQVFAIRGLPL